MKKFIRKKDISNAPSISRFPFRIFWKICLYHSKPKIIFYKIKTVFICIRDSYLYCFFTILVDASFSIKESGYVKSLIQIWNKTLKRMAFNMSPNMRTLNRTINPSTYFQFIWMSKKFNFTKFANSFNFWFAIPTAAFAIFSIIKTGAFSRTKYFLSFCFKNFSTHLTMFHASNIAGEASNVKWRSLYGID